MHLVESEIESERHPGSTSQPLESYVAFARSLPPQFDDHTWVAELSDGTPIGCAACWSNAAGDAQVMESSVYVRRSWRRHGIGSRLARAVVDEAQAGGRATLVWSTYDAVSAGDAFALRMGGQVGRVSRNASCSSKRSIGRRCSRGRTTVPAGRLATRCSSGRGRSPTT